jgi:branched-chain amino acid transport system permease protein
MAYWLVQVLNGLSLAMLLFLVAAGLSVVMGLMRIVNVAHGSFYLVGAYIGLTVFNRSQNYLVALIVAGLSIALLGLLTYALFSKIGREGDSLITVELHQILLGFGVILIIADLALSIWGGIPRIMSEPQLFRGSVQWGPVTYPTFRLFVIVVGLLLAAGLWLLIERTRLGAIVRAGVNDAEMVQGLGINIGLVFVSVFVLGAFLAGVSGVLGGPILGATPGGEFQVLLLALAVAIIGGMGSLEGAFVGALVVGLIDSIGRAVAPEFGMFTIFAPMAAVLVLRPQGLLGGRQ